MRPILGVFLLLAACAGPKPCTRTLCVDTLDGTMRLDGWNRSVTATATSPKPPVMSDSTVTMVYGTAQFHQGKTVVVASEGSSFKFELSTRAVSSIAVSSGSVTVSVDSATPVALTPGAPYYLRNK